ncbi:complement C1q tumor necrosis factor-related protein 4-like [Saccostrea cucullata]|uniref:complement C1q tumor necrosis factor-related protein 4-like n=1 Tax=Saccostrea cuccullata TaxID=36930 RepID=UPI002ED6AEA3
MTQYKYGLKSKHELFKSDIKYHGVFSINYRLVIPGVIAFYAETSTVQQNLPRKAVVFFKNIILNSGGAYDATTGKFTAPNNGIYFFSWTIATAAGNWFSTEIVLNDKIFGRNHVNGKSSSPNYESGSATAIIKVERDDKVWIRVYDEKGYAYAEWSSFSGFQL